MKKRNRSERQCHKVYLFALCFATMSLQSTFAEEDDQFGQSYIAKLEADRVFAISKVDALLDDAKLDIKENEYRKAELKFIEAIDALKNLNGDLAVEKLATVQKEQEAFLISYANRLFEEAKQKFNKGDFEEAKALATSASVKDASRTKQFSQFIGSCQQAISKGDSPYNVSVESIAPKHYDNVEKENILIAQARILYKDQEYQKAIEKLEKALTINEYSTEAMQTLRMVYKKLNGYAELRRNNERIERESEVDWKSTEQIARQMNTTDTIVSRKGSTKVAKVYDKLNNIIFPSVELVDAPIKTVISFLEKQSKKYDPDQTPGKNGVNIILNLQKDERDSLDKVTMDLKNIPMITLLKYMTIGTDLKYKVEENAVIIGKSGTIDALKTQIFRVKPALISRLTGGVSDEDTSSDDVFSGDEFEFSSEEGADAKSDTKNLTSQALVDYFVPQGIKFEGKSTIAYDRKKGELVVTNTPERLLLFQSLLLATDIETPLVIVEAKILKNEYDQEEELGFDMDLAPGSGGNSHIPDGTMDYNMTITDESVLRFKTEKGSNKRDVNLRTDTGTSNIFTGKVFPNFMKDNNGNTYDFNLTIAALEQSSMGEWMSAPKIITQSGLEAEIKIGDAHFFPESYSDPSIEDGGDNGVSAVKRPQPQFASEDKIVGVHLRVTPTVSANNYTIDLLVHSIVLDFADKENFGEFGEITDGFTVYNWSYKDDINEPKSLTVKMPAFKRDEIETSLKVYDGEIIVMGGVLKEQKSNRDDRVPFFGELPLIGRLFGSTHNKKSSTNMLTFIKARLVNNAGVPIRNSSNKGVPEFGR